MLHPVRRQSVVEAVFEQLRDEIVRGRIPADSPLPAERQLCEMLGVNRGAVREAIKRLEQARLVAVKHGGGSLVLNFRTHGGMDLLTALLISGGGALRIEAIRGVMEMRSTLAPEIARLAALHGGEAVADELDVVVREMRDQSDDVAELQRLSMDFWNLLVDGSQNLAYRLAFNTLRETYTQFMPVLAQVLSEEVADLPSFRAIARAVRGGDGKKAQRVAKKNMEIGRSRMVGVLEALKEANLS